MLFKNFFVVSGRGFSKTSKLNAFDKALVDARIDQCNLVPVSSILPPDATPIEYEHIPAGTITFCVLARQDGGQKESVGAGIIWAVCEGRDIKERYGIVAEEHGKNGCEDEIRDKLIEKIMEMAEARNMDVLEYKTEIITIKDTPPKTLGSVVAALVYTN